MNELKRHQKPRDHDYLMKLKNGIDTRAVKGWTVAGKSPIFPADFITIKDNSEL